MTYYHIDDDPIKILGEAIRKGEPVRVESHITIAERCAFCEMFTDDPRKVRAAITFRGLHGYAQVTICGECEARSFALLEAADQLGPGETDDATDR